MRRASAAGRSGGTSSTGHGSGLWSLVRAALQHWCGGLVLGLFGAVVVARRMPSRAPVGGVLVSRASEAGCGSVACGLCCRGESEGGKVMDFCVPSGMTPVTLYI